MDRFKLKLTEHGMGLHKRNVETLQINVGRKCNLMCMHCHVEAGPARATENMGRETAEAVVRFMKVPGITTVDITGGAPELNPNFQYLVLEARAKNLRVIDRCNLTVFYEEGMSGIPDFLARNQVEIVASLPCYLEQNVDNQRGKGTFRKSIEALKWLNELGYGKKRELVLHLVYNPVGPYLPPSQQKLENDYKLKLYDDFGIVFNQLYTITNAPIARYAKYLQALHHYDAYAELLVNSFNLSAVEGLMCVNTISVGWDGRVYDCDFNQMLGMAMYNGRTLSIADLTMTDIENREVLTGGHCFACTAGAGSSCRGALQ
ncbi:MAG: arsenosugar biosynthesis radical SAM (seleno)protein ArsS [Candidatus Loosdrechtia sp.]|uniref:radical SAM/Cys-rich domain protein n=1 Tax=Candidatus Loosdrechtia sp. TaxID=3101272 RepID=UPI003A793332|nr:MAG: arsenosugar biosynthesis radical SAM protein ArsS [Candidatus Jettenia sp. AMX2]